MMKLLYYRHYALCYIHFVLRMPQQATGAVNLPSDALLYTRSTLAKSVMLSVSVSTLGNYGHWTVIQSGAKVNVAYHHDVLLSQNLLPAIRSTAGEAFRFQDAVCFGNRASNTVEYLSRRAPAFTSPNSSDLNPVDFEVCGMLQ